MIDCLFESEYWFFVVKFLLCNLIGGYIVLMTILRYFVTDNRIPACILFILSLGIAPGLIAMIQYYSLLLLPGQSSLTYLLLITVKFVFLFSISTTELKAYQKIFKEIKQWHQKYFQKTIAKISLVAGVLFFMLTLFYLNYYIQSKTITEHDTLEYAVQGKVFYNDKSISYSDHRYDEQSGFYYVGLHGFTFPLLATTERMMNDVAGFNGDQYFRSVNMFFGFLIAFFLYVYLNRYSLMLGVLATLSLVICYGFFETFFKYHIDNTRIFYLLAAIFMLMEYIKSSRISTLILFSILLGLQVNSHSLGALMGMIELFVLFLFVQGSILSRMKTVALASGIVLIFGGVHYVLDVMIGTGWIFQDLKFY